MHMAPPSSSHDRLTSSKRGASSLVLSTLTTCLSARQQERQCQCRHPRSQRASKPIGTPVDTAVTVSMHGAGRARNRQQLAAPILRCRSLVDDATFGMLDPFFGAPPRAPSKRRTRRRYIQSGLFDASLATSLLHRRMWPTAKCECKTIMPTPPPSGPASPGSASNNSTPTAPNASHSNPSGSSTSRRICTLTGTMPPPTRSASRSASGVA
mmetsp:Transcript_4257/g.15695  ORF Transcript_4257/g.15695 Transcript_4257/m.15695 type:complete len:211 (-) Transcript_4257:321-953(-)